MPDQGNRVERRLCSRTAEFFIFTISHLPDVVVFKELQGSGINKIAYQGKILYPCFSERSKQIRII